MSELGNPHTQPWPNDVTMRGEEFSESITVPIMRFHTQGTGNMELARSRNPN
jgi:hypothetical protein